MTKAAALSAVKNRLGISDTTFDTLIESFFPVAVNRLYPRIQKEVAVQTVTPTVDDYGEAVIDLSAQSTPLDDVRFVEATESAHWHPVDSISRHGVSLRVRGLTSTTTQLRLYGLKKYVVASDVVDVPAVFEQPIIWYMMSEFYDSLAGNKSKFNVYTQQAGGNAMDDMRSQSQYFEVKADNYIDEKAQFYGA